MLNIGDRYQHRDGSVWQIKELNPTSVMMAVGADDRVAVSIWELWAYSGEQPYAVMDWRKI